MSENIFEIKSPTGIRHLPPKIRCWAFSPQKYEELRADNRIWFGSDGSARPSVKRFLSEVSAGVIVQSVWLHDEVGHNQEASREIRALFPDEAFGTPKPERLLHRVFHLATNPNPAAKLTPRQIRWARRWMTLVLMGFVVFLVGIQPDLIGMNRSPDVGFVQIYVWLTGLAILLIGAYLTVRVVRTAGP